ncbi:MAG: nickel-dependent lactate racemase [Thermoanaerobacteraceae bacterium]|nr:nickel-dependent lactate racemase [Thermoanaerobacteraceae bacterium]
MAKIKIPFGKRQIYCELDDDRILGEFRSKVQDYRTYLKEEEIVKRALENPIGTKKLQDLAEGKKNIVIVTSDHTRPVPSEITLPLLLEEIRKKNGNANITILIATGFHRETTLDEMKAKFGDNLVENEQFVVHDSRNDEDMKLIGTLPSGGKLELNKLALEADLLVAEGFIEPHFFAGFSGGRKSILPGIASAQCILANHCSEFINSQYARTGVIENNPIHKDMLYAAEKANLAFILNVVIDSEHKIINAFAGHREIAHNEGCKYVSSLATVDVKPADIVITSNGGYPLDQNIYQAVKGMTAGEAACKDGGVIIIVAECADGHGGEGFYNWFKASENPQDIMNKILSRGRDETLPDQWEAQILARILINHKVIMVTDSKNYGYVKDMFMTPAKNLDEALKLAESIVGSNSIINVIPDGVSVIVRNI